MIEESVIQRVLGVALQRGGDFAEIFVEDARSSSAGLDDGKVEDLSSSRSRGAGIRVIEGETTGFAHTTDLSESGLRAAAEAASAVARRGDGEARSIELQATNPAAPNIVDVYPEDVPKGARVELLRRADEAARAEGGSIKQVSARAFDSRRRIMIANSDGLLVGDDQVKTMFNVSCIASGDTGMQTGSDNFARSIGWELFDRIEVEQLARRAAKQAMVKLKARPAPSGAMPVVIGPDSRGGVLFHEACGHGLESDLVTKGASVFQGRRGERVGSPLVNLVDDGTMAEQWGCFAVDDEGSTAQRNVLIEDGILGDYMYDFLRARREGRERSGNGRRMNYKCLPIVRMTNTYLLAGNDDPDDIVRSTDRGIYIAAMGGGQVNTTTGDFVFGMLEAYLIENGEITEPIREGQLIGNGPEVLGNIDAVGSDAPIGRPGTCGKDGQGVPVSHGCPTLRVSAITIGGTAA